MLSREAWASPPVTALHAWALPAAAASHHSTASQSQPADSSMVLSFATLSSVSQLIGAAAATGVPTLLALDKADV